MSLEAARPGSQVDVLVGTGGAPEGVLSACAIRCMGGFMEGRLSPAGEEERALAIKLGLDLGIIGVEAMATSDEVYFAATGESSCSVLSPSSSFFFLSSFLPSFLPSFPPFFLPLVWISSFGLLSNASDLTPQI